MNKAVLAFDKEITPQVQEIVDQLREKLTAEGIVFEAIGGGVKNPK